MREQVAAWRDTGERIALVPTMGNLHRGHVSLIDVAKECAERVIVSIYVNPTQFGPQEDYAEYPRTLDSDKRRLRRAGVDLVFAPDDASMYPFGAEGMTRVSVPKLSSGLCGEARPGHFDGVTSVVCRLFGIVQPDVAVFGQKDYQQLLVIQRMVADLHLPITVVSGPTRREADGLAMSSRNQYLSEAERRRAPELHRALQHCARALRAGDRDFARLEKDGAAALAKAGFETDYFEIRNAADLDSPSSTAASLVVLAAGRCGPARLIDNVIVEL